MSVNVTQLLIDSYFKCHTHFLRHKEVHDIKHVCDIRGMAIHVRRLKMHVRGSKKLNSFKTQ
jgi:hypothetical protein